MHYKTFTKKISGWGNYPCISAEIVEPRNVDDLQGAIAEADAILPRGLGRSHGDAALSGTVLSLGRLNNLLQLDEKRGFLSCEGGVSIAEVLEVVIPSGWFLPVTPGTKQITIGGAIAADVHGKNHHKEGSFGDYIVSMDIVGADGKITICSKDKSPELFHATIGGMGLTGVIARASFRLKRIETSYISQTLLRAKNFEETLKIFDEYRDATYSVAWFDGRSRGSSLGRSVVFLGEHASAHAVLGKNIKLEYSSKKSIPIFFSLPRFAFGDFPVKVFNFLFYATHKPGKSPVSYEPFFYPLDRFSDWNRLYGRFGSIEYQCLIPKKNVQAVQDILEKIALSDCPTFLNTLKLFGKGNKNILSFPEEGYSIGLAFPVREDLFQLIDKLDEIVMRAGGRLYLAKDARMPKHVFDAGYKRAEEFRKFKRSIDPINKFRSLQSMRLGLY